MICDPHEGNSAEALLSNILLRMEELGGDGTPDSVRELIEREPQLIGNAVLTAADYEVIEQQSVALSTINRLMYPPAPDGPGTRDIDDYEILDRLGHGGVGVVYRARHRRLGRLVAIKFLQAGPYASPRLRERFRIEADVLAKLHHPHIVQIIDAGDAGGSPYLVFELIFGTSLRQRLQSKRMSPHTAAKLVEILAQAVQYAHERGVIHRDLKPANVLLTEDDSPRIADFGLAKQLIDAPDLTRTGDVLGTPSYMAPEQLDGLAVGPPADVYALGAVLYETLTGQPPFVGDSTAAVLQAVRGRDPVPPRRIRPHVPRDLQSICLKCLEKQPGSRYSSALELAADLNRFLNKKTTLARPKGVARQSAQWVARHPAAATLVAITVAAVGALLAGSIWHNRTLADALTVSESYRMRAAEEAFVNRQQWDQLRERLYASDMQKAAGAWQNGSLPDLLARLAPYAEGSADSHLRGFEWHFLRRQCELQSRSIPAHDDIVTYLTYIPDRNLLVSASDDGTVKLWREDGQLAGTLSVGTSCVNEVQFVPSRNWLVTANGDGTIKVWDATTHQQLMTLGPHEKPVSCLAIDPEGQTIVAGLTDHDPARHQAEGLVVIWDVSSASVRRVLTNVQRNVHDLELRDDGQLFVASGNLVHRFHLGSGKEVQQYKTHWGHVTSLDFSPDGEKMVSAGHDGLAVLWNIESGALLELMRHPASLTCVRYLDDSRILTTSREGNMYIWDAESGALERKVLAHDSDVFSAAIQRQGARPILCTGSKTGEIKRWDAFSPFERSWKTSHNYYGHCAFDTALRYAVVSRRGRPLGRISLASLDTEVNAAYTSGQVPTAAAVSACGKFCAIRDESGLLEIRNLEDWQLKSKQSGFAGRIVGFTYDSQYLITATAYDLIQWRLTDLSRRTLARLPSEPSRWKITAAAVHPHKQVVAIGGNDAGIVEVELRAAEVPPRKYVPSGFVYDVAYSSNGQLLAVSGGGGAVYILEHGSLAVVHRLVGHAGGVPCVAFSPDGKTLASGGSDGTIRLWHVATGTELLTIRVSPRGLVDEIAFSNDGQRLAAFMDKTEVRVWDIATDVGPSR